MRVAAERRINPVVGGVGGFASVARLLAWLLLPVLSSGAGAAVLHVPPEASHISLNPYVEILEDPAGDLTLADVRSRSFAPNEGGVPNAGFTASAYWYRFTLRRAAGKWPDEPWYLQVGFPLLDEVDIYLPRADGGWEQIQTGDQRPFANRPLKHRNFISRVDLRAKPGTIYLRVKTDSAHVVPLTLTSGPTLFKSAQNELLVLGCYYGVMIALILYNVFGFVSVRDRSYVDYILFVLFCGVLLSLSLNGLGVEYFWTDYPKWTNVSTPFHISAALFWLLAFSRSFLQTRQHFPRMNWLLLALQVACVGTAVLAFTAEYRVAIRPALVLAIVVVAVAVFSTARALALGVQAARIYLLAWLVFAAFVTLQIFQVANLLPAHFITSYIVQIGMAAVSLLLSLALADRINLERREREHLIKERQRAELDAHTKSEFLAHMSHEIRTPMNAIIGFTDLAMRADKEAKRLDFLANIRVASQTLLTILNDILDLSKIEAGKLVLERKEFRLSAVMERLGALFSQVAAEKNLELVLSIPAHLPPVVVGDAVRLEQILVNLVSNALKFSEKGEVEVGVTEEAVLPGRVVLRFSVRDGGIGMTPEQIRHLFQPFVQADQSTTRKYGGTGLGLNICKQLVERMGGNITVSSKLGAGSTFAFTVPFEVPARSSLAQEAQAVVPDMLRGMRTLVVDDSASARKVHDVMLLSLGLQPESVGSGEEAVRRFADQAYQLVLMDWLMPGMDGLEAARRIRALPGGETVPIIMATAHPRDELSRRMSPGLVNATLTKPITPSDLYDALLHLFDVQLDMGRMLPELSATPGADKLRGARVLLVEDNLLNQRLAAEILRGLGMTVDIANDGAEGVAAVAQAKYDAVLMDMQMPVMDGLEATRRIRNNPEFEYLPIIAITANVLPRDSDACLDAGMNDFIPKPLNPAQLIRVLGRWIGPLPGAEVQREPVSQPVPLMPDSPDPIPVREALMRLGANHKLFAELLEIFRSHHAGDHEAFRAAMARGDRKTAHRLVHTLKGVAANLTMPKLWRTSRALQHALEGNEPISDALCSQFEEALDAALGAVEPALMEAKSIRKRA